MMVLVTVIGPGMWEVIPRFGLRWGILGSRVIRSTVIGVKENAYVSAALAIGSSTYRILMRHILPQYYGTINHPVHHTSASVYYN